MSLGFNPFHLAFDPVVLVAIINLAAQLIPRSRIGRDLGMAGGNPKLLG